MVLELSAIIVEHLYQKKKKKEEKRRTKREGKIHEKICNTRREIDFYSNILRNQWDVYFRKPSLQIPKISMKNYELVIFIILTALAWTMGFYAFMRSLSLKLKMADNRCTYQIALQLMSFVLHPQFPRLLKFILTN